ncbi:hypothetical protein [Butyricimonas paravirosa]|uniref:hypothetical protein n=1 Tax=Butyricimonas paravirosa TaxID=1472417 RepID=UPI0022E593C2|nr:hypothetical protein [Butyricimonas paravirosa]
MKRMILVIMMMCVVYSINAQERKVLNIPDSVSIIEQTAHNGQKFNGLLEDLNMGQLYDLYKLDVCRFYELDEYDTELKRKAFKSTPEGQRLTKELGTRKQKIMNSKLYYIFPFSANWGWTKEYNLKTRTFDFSYIIDDDEFIPVQEYVNFRQLLIKCNPAIKQYRKKRYNPNTDRYSYLNTLKIPMSEKIALPIEENIEDLALVVEFKIQNMKYTQRQVAIFNLTTCCLQGISTKVYIIDKSTNEIYFSL